MARHQVHEEAQAALVARGDQRIEVGQGAVVGRDVGVVADVVPEVVLRARIDRGEPDGVDVEGRIGPAQVVEPCANAGKVADAVAVRIGEAARVDLVDDR